MSARRIILASLPSFCQKIIKIGGNLKKFWQKRFCTFFHNFFETRCRQINVEVFRININDSRPTWQPLFQDNLSKPAPERLNQSEFLLKQEMTGGSGINWTIKMQIIWYSFQTDNHASTSSLKFLQAGRSSWRPTKALKNANNSNLINVINKKVQWILGMVAWLRRNVWKHGDGLPAAAAQRLIVPLRVIVVAAVVFTLEHSSSHLQYHLHVEHATDARVRGRVAALPLIGLALFHLPQLNTFTVRRQQQQQRWRPTIATDKPSELPLPRRLCFRRCLSVCLQRLLNGFARNF